MDSNARINLSLIIIAAVLLLILFVYPVIMAAVTDVSNYTIGHGNASVSYGNAVTGFTINEDTINTFNFTINHTGPNVALLNLTQINITLPANFTFINGTNGTGNISTVDGYASSTTVYFANYSQQLLRFNTTTATNNIITVNGTAGTSGGKNGTFFWFNATAGTPGKYNITIRFSYNQSQSSPYNETNITVTVNDTTIPYDVNISNLTDKDGVQLSTTYANVSGKFTINVSALDNGNFSLGNVEFTEITEINVTVHNTTMASYNMTNMTRIGSSGHYWNATINGSTFSDGKYNITLYVKDQRGNVNGTVNISNIVLDSTKPTASASCSDIYSGEAFPCSCSGSDTTSGVKTTSDSSTSPDGTGTPSSTGTFTYSCTITDYAGNTQIASTTYRVSQSGGGSGSGGGGSSSSSSSDTFTYTKTVDKSDTELSESGSITEKLKEKEKVQVKVNGVNHFVGIRKLSDTSTTVEIASDPVQVDLDIGEDVKVNLDDDNFNDLHVTLTSISSSEKKAELTIAYIHEEIPQLAPEETTEEQTITTTNEEPQVRESTGSMKWLWIVIGVIIVIILVYFLIRMKSGGSKTKRYR